MKTTILDNKHTFEEFGFIPLFTQQQPKTGDISHKTQAIAGVSGAWMFGSEIGMKEFEVPLGMIEPNNFLKEEKIDQLVAFFLDSEGQPRPVKMSFRRSPDKFIWAFYSGKSETNYSILTADLTLQFTQMDPHRYSEASAYDPAKPLKYDEANPYGSKSYPNTQSFKWIYSRHYSGIENYSSLNADIKITIKGNVKGGTVTHIGSGVSIAVPDITNGTVVIDTEMFNLQLNGRDTIIDGDFFKLSPGDNGFLFEAETANATVSFEWYHKFS